MKMMSFLPRLVGVGSVKLIRSFHRSCKLAANAYEGEGKTTVTVLNKDADYGLMVDSITNSGFRLNNEVWVLGPMIIFPKSVLGWNIQSTSDINEDSLALFKILEPTLDILVVGLDQTYHSSTHFIKSIREFAKKQSIRVEILPVHQACSTFNFLNAENRYVAAALLPPRQDLPTALSSAAMDAALRLNLRKPDKQIESK